MYWCYTYIYIYAHVYILSSVFGHRALDPPRLGLEEDTVTYIAQVKKEYIQKDQTKYNFLSSFTPMNAKNPMKLILKRSDLQKI